MIAYGASVQYLDSLPYMVRKVPGGHVESYRAPGQEDTVEVYVEDPNRPDPEQPRSAPAVVPALALAPFQFRRPPQTAWGRARRWLRNEAVELGWVLRWARLGIRRRWAEA